MNPLIFYPSRCTGKAFQKMGGLTFGTSCISPAKNSKTERASFLFAFCATLDVEIATLDALDVGHHLSCSSLWWSHPQHWWQGQLVCVTWQLKQSDSGAVNKLGKGTIEMSVASIVFQSSLRQLDSWSRKLSLICEEHLSIWSTKIELWIGQCFFSALSSILITNSGESGRLECVNPVGRLHRRLGNGAKELGGRWNRSGRPGAWLFFLDLWDVSFLFVFFLVEYQWTCHQSIPVKT